VKVLITGASGFLGGHLTEVFLEAGHSVRALVRRTSRTDKLERPGVDIVVGDLKDEEALRTAVDGVQVVVHAASTMAGIPEEYREATIGGTRSLLGAAQEAGVRRFVHISSIGVHRLGSTSGRVITEESPYETDPALLTTYVKSKIGSEKEVLGAAQAGELEVVVVRPGLLYGPGGNWNLPRMGYAFGGGVYAIVGNGSNVLPVCYVRNCAAAVLRAAEAEGVAGQAFNVLDDEGFTQIEYLNRLKAEARPRLKILRMPYPIARAFGRCFGLGMRLLGRANPFHPAHMIACRRRLTYSNERAKQVLGWRPHTGREEALAATMSAIAARERLSRRADIRALGRAPAGCPPLKACIVGCGVIAREHLGFLSRMKNARVVALCDTNEEAARALAAEFRVPGAYGSAGEMLERERPDVLHILTPPQSHAHYARLGASLGCHLLIEKPMATDAAEARAIAEHAASHGVQVCVDHNHLYDSAMVRARRLIESGMAGDVLWVESYYGFNLGENPRSRYMMPGGEQHWTFGLPGGLYQNLAPHPLCLALELLGAPEHVQAHARYGRVLPHADTDELRILLETPLASGLVCVSLAAAPRSQYLRVVGTKGCLTVDLLNKWVLAERSLKGVPKAASRALTNLHHAWTITSGTLGAMAKVLMKRWTPYEGMGVLIREYYAALQEGRTPPVTAQEAIDVMDVMDETWRQIGPAAVRPVRR